MYAEIKCVFFVFVFVFLFFFFFRADYWKSQAKKFCEFCKCWIADNKPVSYLILVNCISEQF